MASQHKVKKSDTFVVREICGKGMSVIAIKDINAGELLIAEEPLFVIPWWIRHSMYPRKELKNNILKALDDLPDEEVDMFYNLSDCKVAEGEEATELGIWNTNNFALGRSDSKSKNGIFPNLSRFNHSCVPSAEFRWHEKMYRQEIRAIRDIDPGEEITLCYFTVEVMEKSRIDRQKYLEDHYGFRCDCQACSLEGEESLVDDNRRMEARSIVKEVIALIYEWEEEEDDEREEQNGINNTENSNNDMRGNDNADKKIPKRLNHLCPDVPNISKETLDNETLDKDNNCISKSLSSGESGNDEMVNDKVNLESSSSDISDDYLKAISLTKRREQLMEILGFKVITRLDVCSNVVDYSKEIGDVKTASAYLKKCCDLARILYGPCSVELSKWKLELSKINSTIVEN